MDTKTHTSADPDELVDPRPKSTETAHDDRGWQPETIASRAASHLDRTLGCVVPPIYPSVAFERAPDGSYPGGHSYARDQNPTFRTVEHALAELDKGHEALLFSSGMAAATTVFEALEPDTRVVIPQEMYFTIQGWIQGLAQRQRLALTQVPAGDLLALRDALAGRGPKLVWLETPSNPLCIITDLERAIALAHQADATVVVDGTTPTPALTRPLELGADLVLHSATKQLNGHNDVLAGALVTARADAFWQRIRDERAYRGAVLGSFEAWLLQRGLRTLFLRVRAACRSAEHLAHALQGHPKLVQVLYPGLQEHPGHDVACRQMTGGFGSLLSLRLCGGADAARRVLTALQLFRNATSLGGVESLVEHRASIEGPNSRVPGDLLRLSIGIEATSDLQADLEAALERA